MWGKRDYLGRRSCHRNVKVYAPIKILVYLEKLFFLKFLLSSWIENMVYHHFKQMERYISQLMICFRNGLNVSIYSHLLNERTFIVFCILGKRSNGCISFLKWFRKTWEIWYNIFMKDMRSINDIALIVMFILLNIPWKMKW